MLIIALVNLNSLATTTSIPDRWLPTTQITPNTSITRIMTQASQISCSLILDNLLPSEQELFFLLVEGSLFLFEHLGGGDIVVLFQHKQSPHHEIVLLRRMHQVEVFEFEPEVLDDLADNRARGVSLDEPQCKNGVVIEIELTEFLEQIELLLAFDILHLLPLGPLRLVALDHEQIGVVGELAQLVRVQIRRVCLGSIETVEVNELEVLQGEEFPLTCRAEENLIEYSPGQIARSQHDHKEEPVPDENENDLVEDVDAEHALDEVGMNGAHLADVDLAQGHARKYGHVGPLHLVHK